LEAEPPPRLSVVVPAYREQDLIGSTVRRLYQRLRPVDARVEVIVVDDGSEDRTAAEASEAGATVISLDRHRGKGAAVRAGVLEAAGRTVAFIDADLAYPPEQLIGLMEEVESGADVVVGSRRHVDTVTLAKVRRIRGVSGRVFNWLTRAVVLGEVRDTQCGIKAFSAEAARAVFSRGRVDGFAFDVEIFVIARALGLQVTEVPVELTNTRRSSVRVHRDAGRMVGDLAAIRWRALRGRYRQPGQPTPPSRLGRPWPGSTTSSRPTT